jgi:hypothetical protein
MRKFLLLFVIVIAGCETPLTPPVEPLAVRPIDLVHGYRDQTTIAQTAYDNITISLSLPSGSYTVSGNTICWHLASKEFPPVIVFHFKEPPAKTHRSLTIIGVCQGRHDDNKDREFMGFTFCITVSECRFANPPALPAPR